VKNDRQLQSDVEQELRWDPSIRAERIGVSVNGGVVELDGHVESFFEKWAAERAALRAANVAAIASEISVELPASAERTDEDIARSVANHLEWNDSVPNTVKVQVTGGQVKLVGATQWHYQREAAETAVRWVTGVRGVSNEITIAPAVSAEGVRDRIEKALKRNAALDAHHITVDSSGGDVTLRGVVRSWAEREQAEHAAWAAPGVTSVDDRITID
jgi:osmotically-inducible protein OsmY